MMLKDLLWVRVLSLIMIWIGIMLTGWAIMALFMMKIGWLTCFLSFSSICIYIPAFLLERCATVYLKGNSDVSRLERPITDP